VTGSEQTATVPVPESAPRRHGALPVAAGVCLAATVVGLAWVLRHYLADEAILPSGTGSSLVHRARGVDAVVFGVIGVAFAGGAFALRRRSPAICGTLGVLGVVSAIVAVALYPTGTDARLVALHDGSEAAWSLSLGVEYVTGVRSETESQLVLVGSDETGDVCENRPVEVVVDLATHHVVEIRRMPTFYPDAASLPPAPVPPDLTRYRIEPGAQVRSCSS
jgi:hypothetical protein